MATVSKFKRSTKAFAKQLASTKTTEASMWQLPNSVLEPVNPVGPAPGHGKRAAKTRHS